MQTNTQVTTGYRLKCLASGLFLSDATPQFECISVTNAKERALPFPDLDAVTNAQKMVGSIYGSFDWQPVGA